LDALMHISFGITNLHMLMIFPLLHSFLQNKIHVTKFQ
jgi:hypothetical protein